MKNSISMKLELLAKQNEGEDLSFSETRKCLLVEMKKMMVVQERE